MSTQEDNSHTLAICICNIFSLNCRNILKIAHRANNGRSNISMLSANRVSIRLIMLRNVAGTAREGERPRIRSSLFSFIRVWQLVQISDSPQCREHSVRRACGVYSAQEKGRRLRRAGRRRPRILLKPSRRTRRLRRRRRRGDCRH